VVDPTKARQKKAGAETVRRLRAMRVGDNRRRKLALEKENMIALDIIRTTRILSNVAGNL
jgi:hypothetical protein